jgi:hypothetical protein
MQLPCYPRRDRAMITRLPAGGTSNTYVSDIRHRASSCFRTARYEARLRGARLTGLLQSVAQPGLDAPGRSHRWREHIPHLAGCSTLCRCHDPLQSIPVGPFGARPSDMLNVLRSESPRHRSPRRGGSVCPPLEKASQCAHNRREREGFSRRCP